MTVFIKKIRLLGVIILALLSCHILHAQTTLNPNGGRPSNAVYNFLTLPYSAKATALGGMNISSLKNDLGLATFNPSLLDRSMDGTLHLSIKPYLADIKQYDFSGAHSKHNYVMGWGVHYLNYGPIQSTDIAGNPMGEFNPSDYSVQFSMAGKYMENFYLGSTLKFIQSNYGVYTSSGLGLDVGLRYKSPNDLNQFSILVKNIGTQLKSYTQKEELPFNLILGWTKKLQNAPIQFSLTAEKLSLWNLAYNDTTFNNQEGYQNAGSLQNLFNHFIIASEFYMGDQFEINIGYNFMRRFDLNIQNQQNWLNGFSTGLGFQLTKLDLQYGNAFFQKNMYHHFTVFYHLKN